MLTEALCHVAGRVTAVEVDPRLHAHLETRQAEFPNVELVCGDALEYPVENLPIGDGRRGESALLHFNPGTL